MTNGEARLREALDKLTVYYADGHTDERGNLLSLLAYKDVVAALAASVQAGVVKDAQTGARDEMADHLAPSSGRRKSEQDAGASPASPALSIPESVQAEVGAGDALSKRITYYLAMGGLWNPESMDHNGVRQLLIDCRDALAARPDVVAVQAEVGAGEQALAQRIIDLPCIVEVRGPDVVGQIAELLAARPDVAGGGLRRWANTGPEGMMQVHPLGEFVLLADVRAVGKEGKGALREAVIAELYKRHPQLGARSIDEFADFVDAGRAGSKVSITQVLRTSPWCEVCHADLRNGILGWYCPNCNVTRTPQQSALEANAPQSFQPQTSRREEGGLLTKQECWEAWSSSQIKGPVALTDWQMVADKLNALRARAALAGDGRENAE